MNRHFFTAAFIAGLAGLVWVAIGFIDSSPLAIVVTAVIAAFYGWGALELRQYRQATASLDAALNAIPDPLPELGAWLSRIHPSLQNPVRLRIEGERSALPGPTMTPYLVGLLVMLGMLGTFLGMVVTLKGAVFALEKTTDLQAMRSALAVPVKGLGLAFGTSVAGVMASAMLGLMSSFSRRERLHSAQVLESRIATSLRVHSLAWQRQESFKAQQQQAQAWPQLLDRMQAMMTQMDNMGQQLNQRLLGNQEEFHRQAQSAYTGLASAVEQSLKENLLHSAQAAGDSLKPVLEATMTSLAREAAQLQQRSADTAQAQLETLSARLTDSTQASSRALESAQQKQDNANSQLLTRLDGALQGFNQSFAQGAQDLVQTMEQRWSAQQEAQAAREQQAQAAWMQTLQATGENLAKQWQARSEQSLAQQQAWSESLRSTGQALSEQWQHSSERSLAQQQTWTDALQTTVNALDARWQESGERAQSQQQAWTESLQATAQALAEQWKQIGERAQTQQQAWTETLQATARALAAQWQHSGEQTLAQQQTLAASMLESVKALDAQNRESHAQTLAQTHTVLTQAEELVRQRIASEAQWMDQHRERMEHLAASVQTGLSALRQAEAERGDAAVQRLGELQAALATHLTTLGTALEDPITRLIHAASEAPRAAAEVIAQLRQEISRSVARDNEVLEERSRILDTLNGLLNAINQASSEQRGVIESLVKQAAGALQASNQVFAEQVESRAVKLDEIAAQVGGSAIEVASLSEAFGAAVQSYGTANEKLIENLARIEAAVDKSLARSDDQLAYYLAQAREIIDLSMSSQKEFVEELRRVPSQAAEEAR